LEDLLIAHGGFDGDMSRAEAVKLDDQFGSSLQIKLTTLESSTKYTIVYWTYCILIRFGKFSEYYQGISQRGITTGWVVLLHQTKQELQELIQEELLDSTRA